MKIFVDHLWFGSIVAYDGTVPSDAVAVTVPESKTHTSDVTSTLIPISKIKINRRMRRTDENRIQDLAESIKGIGLLHNISVAQKDDDYILLSGLHRIEAMKILGETMISATVRP